MLKPKYFVLLDRDGTIIKDCHYLSDPDLVELLPGAAEGLRQLQALGLGLVVVTNQSPIGRGWFDDRRLEEIHQRLRALLVDEGVNLDGIYYCPHLPEDRCACRKPNRGMVDSAVRDFNFEPNTSFAIGDKPCDIELGQNIGATTFLVRTGYGAKVEHDGSAKADYIVDNLQDAAQIIAQLVQCTQILT
ncbi:HAD family hydrolase [Tumidithrix elongata RA019]|uniref:D,D-heptose 1,7-bisphosphate phosphatase n=1 Tax=Tumidithrix elongata BACA0141 TaxID=2716417 RepID=A0AAW9PZM2_9CYAN|nr:HAD family hydrolase [Tumidithrix elongata RA019]